MFQQTKKNKFEEKLLIAIIIASVFITLTEPAYARIFSNSKKKVVRFFKRAILAGDIPLRGEIWYGNASWYGGRWHGRKTSNGEKFNKRELTAAHQTLPFNTKVRVTNMKNNKSVIVRINDRGPFHGGRIIDLSEKAAEKIESKRPGIAHVKVQVIGYDN